MFNLSVFNLLNSVDIKYCNCLILLKCFLLIGLKNNLRISGSFFHVGGNFSDKPHSNTNRFIYYFDKYIKIEGSIMKIKKNSMDYIFSMIAAQIKKKIWLEHNAHSILESPDHNQIVLEVFNFIQEISP